MSIKAILTEQQKSYTKAEEDTLLATKYDKEYIDTYMAPLDTPTFIGVPKAPTATVGTNTTQIATTAFVHDELQRKPNENLLDNWYFDNPINSRGLSGYTTSGAYTIDRWKIYRGVISFVNDHEFWWLWDGTGTYSPLHQKINNWDIIAGKTITMSAITNLGFYQDTFVVPTSGTYQTSSGNIRFLANAASKALEIGNFYSTGSIRLFAAKAELGTVQTLGDGITQVPYEIPNYEIELLKCESSTADPDDEYANKSFATEQQLAYVESGTFATKTGGYMIGDYFCKDGLLYRATARILQFSDFTAQNCTPTTVMKEFSTVNMFKVLQQSGTTSSLGNLDLSVSPNAIIVGIRPSQQQGISYIGRGSSGNYYCHMVNSSGAAITSTSVTVDVYYVN